MMTHAALLHSFLQPSVPVTCCDKRIRFNDRCAYHPYHSSLASLATKPMYWMHVFRTELGFTRRRGVGDPMRYT